MYNKYLTSTQKYRSNLTDSFLFKKTPTPNKTKNKKTYTKRKSSATLGKVLKEKINSTILIGAFTYENKFLAGTKTNRRYK